MSHDTVALSRRPVLPVHRSADSLAHELGLPGIRAAMNEPPLLMGMYERSGRYVSHQPPGGGGRGGGGRLSRVDGAGGVGHRVRSGDSTLIESRHLPVASRLYFQNAMI